jgi:two-component system sensor histidine kinase KdpD
LLDARRPAFAIATGALLAAVIALALAPFHDDVTRAVPALLLVIPVIFATVIGGRFAGLLVAAVATLAFALIIPPLGSPRIRLGEDVVALAVFIVVALVASALVTTKIEALHDVDTQRRALLRSVSHDLRTPLAAIHAVATDLRSGIDYDVQTRDELLDILIDESDRLDRFVGNLLSMSRIEAGTLRPDLQPVDVGEIVDRCVQRFERLARKPIDVDVAADLPFVVADHVQLEQAIANLFENAVRHAPDSSIHVHAHATPTHVDVTVADDGPGLPAVVREHLGAAARGQDATSVSPGFGLAIVLAIARLHGGTVSLADGDRGTSVTIGLRRAE